MKLKILLSATLFGFSMFYAYAQKGLHYGIAISTINDMIEVAPGEIWAATDSGMVHFTNNGAQETLYHSDTLGSGSFHRVVKNGDSIYAGADYALYKWDGSKWIIISYLGVPVTEIHFTPFNEMWCIAGGQLHRQVGGVLIDQNRQASCIASYLNNVYIGTLSFSQPGFKYVGSNWSALPTSSVIRQNKVYDLELDDFGNIWVSTEDGVLKHSGSSWNSIVSSSDPVGDLIKIDNEFYAPDDYTTFNGGSVFHLSNSGVDTAFNPDYLFDSPTHCATKGLDNSILLGKGARIFRFYPSLLNQKDYEELTINGITAGVSAGGDLFQNMSSREGHIGLLSEGKRSLYSANLWTSAIRPDGTQMTAANAYNQGGRDYYSGPISQVYDSLYLSRYNSVWRVTTAEIQTHSQQYNSSSYTAPHGIKNWPGNGDQSRGEPKYIAPFIDVNFNGVYEPEKGDYPDIRGDEAIFFIQNDTRGLKSKSFSASMNLELHGMMYAFDSANAPEIYNSIFLSYKVYNRSPEAYSDFKFGLWLDPDLGNALDDLIGCDSTTGVFYSYNANNYDSGPRGYGANPPAIGGMFLSDSLDGFGYFSNPGNVGVPYNTTDPSFVTQFAGYLNQNWLDGSPIRVENPNGLYDASGLNGDGYDPNGSGRPTRFAYNDAINWYESPSNLSDKRLVSTLDVGTIAPGEHKCVDLALIYARDSAVAPQQAFSSVTKLKSYASDINQFFDDQQFPDCIGENISIDDEQLSTTLIDFYPNPVSRGGTVHLDYGKGLSKVSLVDFNGRIVKEYQLNGEEQFEFEISENTSSGLYLMLVQSKEGISSSLKISVQ